MGIPTKKRVLTYFIASVWLINGLVCKVLNLVPRHEEIVATILGDTWSRPLTIGIGVLEIGMALWVVSGIAKRVNGLIQIGLVGAMNVLELILAPDLLLWGPYNAAFALLFMGLVYYESHILTPRSAHPNSSSPHA